MSYVYEQLLVETPYILACVGGVVLAVTLWRRAPSSSICVVVACGVTLFLLALHPIAWEIATRISRSSAINVLFGVLWSIERAIFAILLLLAVYLGRAQK
jgi:hypothetical protein